jgi:FAD/FMN-containing dehydrogenase
MWQIRESIPEALVKSGKAVFKYDVSTSVSKCYALVEEMKKRFAEKNMLGREVTSCVGYGHVGDGTHIC